MLALRVAAELAAAALILGALIATSHPSAQPRPTPAARWAATVSPYVARLSEDAVRYPSRLPADVARAERAVAPAPVPGWERIWTYALSALAAGDTAGGGDSLVALSQTMEASTRR